MFFEKITRQSRLCRLMCGKASPFRLMLLKVLSLCLTFAEWQRRGLSIILEKTCRKGCAFPHISGQSPKNILACLMFIKSKKRAAEKSEQSFFCRFDCRQIVGLAEFDIELLIHAFEQIEQLVGSDADFLRAGV